VLSAAWLAIQSPPVLAAARDARRAADLRLPFDVLSEDEATELEALAAQIFPTDETPGAREAGVIYFMDKALGSFAASQLAGIRTGLVDLRQRVASKHPGADRFSALPFSDQTSLVRDIEQTSFFARVQSLTVMGMFADPAYGGNRDRIGWTLLGFDPQPQYEPPFGHYDAEERDSR
jgi:gluconate 2-dehydrogenase gamma chain